MYILVFFVKFSTPKAHFIPKEVLKINTEKIRVSREDSFLKNKKVNDISYLVLFMEASFNPNNKKYRTIKIKDVNYSKLSKKAGISRQTYSRHIKNLIETNFIQVNQEEEEYILPIPQEFYFDIEQETIRKLTSFAKSNSIKLYAFLLGWYNYYKNKKEDYTFSYDGLCEAIGLAPRQPKNRETIKDILEMLERLGLIKVSPCADSKKLINGIEVSSYRLIYARDALPKLAP